MRLLSPGYLLFLLAIPPLIWLSLRAQARVAAAAGKADALSPGRRRLFIAMRISALALLVLALAGPSVSRSTGGIAVVFLLDESESVSPEGHDRAVQMIETIRSGLSRDDHALLVRFAGNAVAEELTPEARVPIEAVQEMDRSSTDIGRAIQFALAQLPEEGSRKLVVFSDGNENRGKAAEAAALARSFGVQVFSVPIVLPQTQSEVSVEAILAPERVRVGEPHEITALVKSRTRTAARISLFRDGAPIGVQNGILEAGENSVSVTASLPEAGLHSYEALVETPDDQFLQNNHGKRFVEVTGKPTVLYVSKRGARSSALLAALETQRIAVVEKEPAELPGAIQGYVPYDGIILDNVPGYALSFEKMQLLELYVRDVGGGLLMIGGDTSFGAGGYYKTPIERILPVDMDVKSQVQMPLLSLVVLTDKSGSMGSNVPTGETKLDVVKSAAIAAIELLNPFDRVGLIAFDADWEWTVPITEARNRELVADELSTLSPGGGTDLYPALLEAHRVLAATPSALKHIIIISDGLTQKADFGREISRISRDKITVSTVAVGEDADRELLSDMATVGKGRYYFTSDPTTVPRIFVTETMLVSRGLIMEKRFLPQASPGSEILQGIPRSTIPPLDGFVLTYLKTGAEEALRALYDAPLLATWRYGLGKAAAFTSDLKGRWAKSWIPWSGYARFSAQLVRWIQRPVSYEVLKPVIAFAAGKGNISVDAVDEMSAFVNGLDLRAVILGPGGSREEVRLRQTAPGLYQGSFRAEKTGDYAVTIASPSSPDTAPRTIGMSLPYPDEYRDIGVNTTLLSSLAAATGGASLPLSAAAPDSSSEERRELIMAQDTAEAAGWRALYKRDSRGIMESSPLWPFLVLAALFAFFLDIAARKFTLPEAARERLEALFTRMRRRENYDYGDLARMVTTAKEEEKRKLREKISGMTNAGKIDPDLAAYLYIARLKGRTREKEAEKKEDRK